jgi:NitT/TauT family transport system permease protein
MPPPDPSRLIGAAAAALRPTAGILAAIGLWWTTITVLHIDDTLAASPPQVAAAYLRQPGYLLRNAATTLTEITVGYTIAVTLGLLLGAALAASRRVEDIVMPAVVAFNAVPKIAFAPLLIVWMGFTPAPKIAMAALVSFWPITLATTTGLTSTPTELVQLARALTATRLQTLTRIQLPAALPHIFTGLKTAMPLAVIGALVAELAGTDAGLGYIIQTAGTDTATAFAAIGLLALISLTLFALLNLAQRHLLPWDPVPTLGAPPRCTRWSPGPHPGTADHTDDDPANVERR